MRLIIVYGISVLTIILGFIALLTQKVYIDVRTQQPTEIDIPIMGKMRTNYPALIFVFIGGVLAFYAYSKSPEKKPWEIIGSFKAGDKIDWQDGTLTVFPTDFKLSVNPDGTFRIEAFIEEASAFENVVQRIDYSNRQGSVQIYPKEEYDAYRTGKDTLIKKVTNNSREYKQVPLQIYSDK